MDEEIKFIQNRFNCSFEIAKIVVEYAYQEGYVMVKPEVHNMWTGLNFQNDNGEILSCYETSKFPVAGEIRPAITISDMEPNLTSQINVEGSINFYRCRTLKMAKEDVQVIDYTDTVYPVSKVYDEGSNLVALLSEAVSKVTFDGNVVRYYDNSALNESQTPTRTIVFDEGDYSILGKINVAKSYGDAVAEEFDLSIQEVPRSYFLQQ